MSEKLKIYKNGISVQSKRCRIVIINGKIPDTVTIEITSKSGGPFAAASQLRGEWNVATVNMYGQSMKMLRKAINLYLAREIAGDEFMKYYNESNSEKTDIL